jgi:quercetin dioxygenase-like cupin family protein
MAKFHTHSSDQILIVTEGSEIVSTEKERATIGVGDFVLIPAEEKHWHGATADSEFAYIQIQAQDSKTI